MRASGVQTAAGNAPRTAAACASPQRVPRKPPLIGGEPLADRDDLLGRLAFAEDHFRVPLAQGAVVVDAGEGEVFEGQMTQPVQRRVGSQASGGDFGEEGAELLGVHATWATGSRYSRKIASASATDSIWKSRWRRSLAPCSPLVYQPRCLRNSITVLRVSPWSRSASRACVERDLEPLVRVRRRRLSAAGQQRLAIPEQPRVAERPAPDHDPGATGVVPHAHDVRRGA